MITAHMSEQDQHRELFDRWMYGVNTCLPGVIQEFYPATQTATVKPAIQMQVVDMDGTTRYEDAPVLLQVPVCFPFAAGFALTMPVQAGDNCVLVFSQRCIDNWHELGGVQPPDDGALNRHHDLSDAFAILGVPDLTQVIPEWLTEGIELRNTARSTRVTVKDNSAEVVCGGNSISISRQTTTITGNVETDSHVAVGTGWSGIFVDALGKVMTVQDGIIIGGS